MVTLNKRERFLVAALAVGSTVLWFGLPGDSKSLDSINRPTTGTLELGEPPRVRVGLLAPKKPADAPHWRDLFRYHQPPKIRPTKTTETPRQSGGDSHRAYVPLPDTDSSNAPATLTRREPSLTYIGLLGNKDDLIAVFDKGTEVVVAKVGDTIGDGLELLEFRYDAVVLRYTSKEFNGDTTTLRKWPG